MLFWMAFSSAPWGGRFYAIFEVHVFHHGDLKKNQREPILLSEDFPGRVGSFGTVKQQKNMVRFGGNRKIDVLKHDSYEHEI